MSDKQSFYQCLMKIEFLLDQVEENWSLIKSKRWLRRKVFRRPFYKKRLTLGFFNTGFQELKSDPEFMYKYIRMNLEAFKQLLRLVKPEIIILRNRSDVPKAEERLAITLRYKLV